MLFVLLSMIHVLFSVQDGHTALMEASSKGHVQCAQLLLDRGAQADIQDKVSTP